MSFAQALQKAGLEMSDLKDEKLKSIVKAAITDLMREQFERFGKWTFYGIASAAFLYALKVILLAK